jgi:hypothetical protein
MAHTPGPWTAKSEVGRIILNGSSIYGVADITGEFAGWNPDDLLLMAAAPELLAALKAHLPWHTEPAQGWGVWQDAVAAINKAEGRTE